MRVLGSIAIALRFIWGVFVCLIFAFTTDLSVHSHKISHPLNKKDCLTGDFVFGRGDNRIIVRIVSWRELIGANWSANSRSL